MGEGPRWCRDKKVTRLTGEQTVSRWSVEGDGQAQDRGHGAARGPGIGAHHGQGRPGPRSVTAVRARTMSLQGAGAGSPGLSTWWGLWVSGGGKKGEESTKGRSYQAGETPARGEGTDR